MYTAYQCTDFYERLKTLCRNRCIGNNQHRPQRCFHDPNPLEHHKPLSLNSYTNSPIRSSFTTIELIYSTGAKSATTSNPSIRQSTSSISHIQANSSIQRLGRQTRLDVLDKCRLREALRSVCCSGLFITRSKISNPRVESILDDSEFLIRAFQHHI
jgi:hypothetical protein